MPNRLKDFDKFFNLPKSTRRGALVIALAFAGFLPIHPVMGATDGEIGSSSQGSVGITVAIPALVRISNLEDMSFGTWDGTQSMSNEDQVCVWSSSRGYSLTGVGSGGGAFVMRDDTGNEIPFSVEWAAPSGGAQTLQPGQTVAELSSPSIDTTCSDAASMALMTVGISQEDLAAAPAGDYGGVLTLTVASE